MSTLPDRRNTALVIIDAQNAVVAQAYRRDDIIQTIARLLANARRSETSVIWVQHSDDNLIQGTTEWEYVPELVRREGESLVEKHYGDAFEGTDLEEILSATNVGHVVVAGAETDACIRSTIHGAFVRGYDVDLVADAHTTNDKSAWGVPPADRVIAHTNMYWAHQTAPGKTARVLNSADVSFTR